MTDIQKEAHLVYTLLFIFHMTLSFLVAISISYRKVIGYFWSFFFGLVFTPLAGLVITSLSRDRLTKDPPPHWQVIIPLLLMGVIICFTVSGILWIVPGNYAILLTGWALIALIGTFLYFFQQKKKKRHLEDISK